MGRGPYEAFASNETFAHQKGLPRLPLRSVKETLDKFLTTVEPFVTSEDERRKVREDVEAALADPELARRQRELEALRASADNWLDRFWIPGCYMAWRAALPINSNVTGYLFGEHRKSWDQIFSAAALARGALLFHIGLLEGTVEPLKSKAGPQCMDQYTRMFSLNRVPGVVEDHLVKYSEAESRHIAVIANKRIYTLPVLGENREVIPIDLLYASLASIHQEAKQRGPDPNPMCVLTGTDRTTWAKVRNGLVADPINAKALKDVESALFTLSLEQGVDASDDDCGRSCFVGDGQTSWFDKSFQIKVKQDGNPSINIEHSWADAPVPLDMFFNRALPYAEGLDASATIAAGRAAAGAHRSGPWAPHSAVKWNVTSEVAAHLAAAKKIMQEAIADSDVKVYRCKGLGTPVWKAAGISPDAAVQMAMQLAYRRLTGAAEPVATYETIGMVSYLKGRTETCRVVSEASEAFVKGAMGGYLRTRDEADRPEAKRLLVEACRAHLQYLSDGQKGEGVDRHMFGLRMLSEDGSQPALFSNPLFEKSGSTGGFVLSTSNNSYIKRPFGGLFGTVMPDGYGVCYIPRTEEVTLCVESKVSCKTTNSEAFCQAVEQALRDIAAIAGAPTSKL